MGPARIPQARYAYIQRHLPLTCVDVLPMRDGRGPVEVGLIRRFYPEAGARSARTVWCALGGRLGYGETIPEAIRRQVRETLGEGVLARVAQRPQPIAVVEFLPRRPPSAGPHDPRQHAVGLLYAVPISGEIRPRGEALGFSWFPARRLPPARSIGFGLSATLRSCAAKLADVRRVRSAVPASRTGRQRSSR